MRKKTMEGARIVGFRDRAPQSSLDECVHFSPDRVGERVDIAEHSCAAFINEDTVCDRLFQRFKRGPAPRAAVVEELELEDPHDFDVIVPSD